MVYLTIDAGGTFLKSALLTTEGEIISETEHTEQSCSAGSKSDIQAAFEKLILRALDNADKKEMALKAIGIAFPGPFDYKEGVSLMNHKFKQIYGINLKDTFRTISPRLRGVPVEFIHDANAVLAGELIRGNAKDFRNVGVVILGTGLGFALSKNQVIQTNESGGPGVSIFKIPFNNGILEDYVSRRGFLRVYQDQFDEPIGNLDVHDIGFFADRREPAAMLTFETVSNILASSLAPILTEHQVDCLLFGGQISKSFHHMEKSLRKAFTQLGVSGLKQITQVKYIDNAPLYGALQAVVKPASLQRATPQSIL